VSEANPFSRAQSTIAVVGATGGIGGACAQAAAAQGGKLWLLGRDEGKLGTQQTALGAAGTVACDLEQPEAIVTAVGALPELDGVVFAAGVLLIRPLRLSGPPEFRRLMAINYEGPALFCRELLRQRKLRDGGSIVLIGSIAGRIGAVAHTVYSGSKGALAAFARSLALELAPRRIRVNTLSPGLVQTAMAKETSAHLSAEESERYAREYPLGLGEPRDVANAACFLLSPGARWMTGADLVLDGGVSVR
jgi:NAD(P)-dependent dehydrogenase (short-subunit alcohol dehydrogenase family)